MQCDVRRIICIRNNDEDKGKATKILPKKIYSELSDLCNAIKKSMDKIS